MRAKHWIAIAFGMACEMVIPTASADSWTLEQETRIYKFSNGLRFEYTVDPIDRGNWAKFSIKVKNGAVLLARYDTLGFEDLYASPDESLFLGLSNSGIPGPAVVVFNRQGEVLLLVQHDVAEFDYCAKSIYVERLWHSSEKEDIQFGDMQSLSEITLKNCRGERVNLLHTVAEAYERALHREKGH